MTDDYHPGLLANDSTVIKKAWLQHYRPIGWLQHEAAVRLDPGYFRGRAPKILAGVYLSLAASLLFFFLRHCGTGVPAAAVVSAGFVLSPLVNEITLWNVCAPLDLALAWFILGALLWAKHAGAGRLALGTACILLGTLTYQTYLTIVPMLLLYEVSSNLLRAAPLKLSAIAKKLSLLAAVALFGIGYMVVSCDLLGYSAERGFGTATWPGAYLSAKFHAVSDVTVNTLVPVLAYYTGIETALRVWAPVPLALAGAAGAVALWRGLGWMRAAALAAGPCAMLVIAATPFLLINEQPESWRLAIPGMLGLMLSVGFTLELLRVRTTRLEGRLSAAAIALFGAALAGVLYPVAAYEARRRILGEDLDREVIEVIRAHWGEGSAKAAEFRVIVPDSVSSNNAAFVRLEDIATAYHKIGPTTSLGAPWAWRGFVAEQGLRPIPAEEARAFQGLRERCLAEAGPGQRYTG